MDLGGSTSEYSRSGDRWNPGTLPPSCIAWHSPCILWWADTWIWASASAETLRELPWSRAGSSSPGAAVQGRRWKSAASALVHQVLAAGAAGSLGPWRPALSLLSPPWSLGEDGAGCAAVSSSCTRSSALRWSCRPWYRFCCSQPPTTPSCGWGSFFSTLGLGSSSSPLPSPQAQRSAPRDPGSDCGHPRKACLSLRSPRGRGGGLRLEGGKDEERVVLKTGASSISAFQVQVHLDVVVTQLHAQLVKPLDQPHPVRVADRWRWARGIRASTASSLASRGGSPAVSSKMSSSSDEHCWDESVLLSSSSKRTFLTCSAVMVSWLLRTAQTSCGNKCWSSWRTGGRGWSSAPYARHFLQQALQPGLVSNSLAVL